MESDFSMCLAYLLNYEETNDTSKPIRLAIEMKKQVFAVAWHHVGEEDLLMSAREEGGPENGNMQDDYFDFETLNA